MSGDGEIKRLCRQVGISYRQFDYWADAGLLLGARAQGSGTGNPRSIGKDGREHLAVMASLVKAGVIATKASAYATELLVMGVTMIGPYPLTMRSEAPEPDPAMSVCPKCKKTLALEADGSKTCDGIQVLRTNPYEEEINDNHTKELLCMGLVLDLAMEI